jgi:integrase
MTTTQRTPKRSSRRGHNEGSIYQREDGYWVAAVDLGYVDGKRKRKPIYGKTRAEVARKLTEALKARQDGLPQPNERLTVRAFLTDWLASIESAVRPRTVMRYEEVLRIHVPDSLGKLPLAKLGPQHLQALYADRLSAGLSPASVVKLHNILHRALGQAVRWGLLVRNPADLVDPPRIPKHDMQTFTPEQAQRFLAAAEGDPLEALYVLAITCGMRQGELLALRWRDVDLDRRSISVRNTLTRTKAGLTFGETKNGKARQVTLSARAVEALRRHRLKQNTERLRLGGAWDDNDLVFPNQLGKPMEARNLLSRSFLPLLERAGLPKIRFHDLRHSAATLLLGQNVHPKVVSEMLGHSQIAVTLNLYSHVTETMQQQAADTMDRLLASS